MTTFADVLRMSVGPSPDLQQRLRLMQEIESITGRGLLVYAADLQKANAPVPNTIDRSDKVGFSDLVNGYEGKPIDILLESPGGLAEAAEEIVGLLRSRCPSIRFVVPGNAMSAATLIALSGDAILMDDRSSLGPIDPQVAVPMGNGMIRVPAQTILDGFEKARNQILRDGPQAIPAFMPLLTKYDLHLLEICDNAKTLSHSLAVQWLSKYMLTGDESQRLKDAQQIADQLIDHSQFLSHGRSVRIDRAQQIGLNILDLRTQPELQEKFWQLYCWILVFLERSGSVKMFENGLGINWSRQIRQQADKPANASQKSAGKKHKR